MNEEKKSNISIDIKNDNLNPPKAKKKKKEKMSYM